MKWVWRILIGILVAVIVAYCGLLGYIYLNQRTLRFTWTSPVAFIPQKPETILMGSQYVLRSDVMYRA